MISENEARTQILRFAGLQKFPRDNTVFDRSARAELLKALQSVSRNVDHAERIVSAWIEDTANGQFCPAPAHLYAIASQMASEAVQDYSPHREQTLTPSLWFSIWTDRDVAIHEALATDGLTKYAKLYGRQMLTAWNEYCAKQSDSWEVPMYRGLGIVPLGICRSCAGVGWEYLGPFNVRRCHCRVMSTRKTAQKLLGTYKELTA